MTYNKLKITKHIGSRAKKLDKYCIKNNGKQKNIKLLALDKPDLCVYLILRLPMIKNKI